MLAARSHGLVDDSDGRHFLFPGARATATACAAAAQSQSAATARAGTMVQQVVHVHHGSQPPALLVVAADPVVRHGAWLC